MAAISLSANFGARRRFSVASGWFQRAQRLLAEEPEGPEHGFLAWAATMFALATGDHDGGAPGGPAGLRPRPPFRRP
jgi:hypothetical protein